MNVIDFIRKQVSSGESQSAVARKCGISQALVNKMMYDDYAVKLETIKKIANAYNTPISFFINDTGNLAVIQPDSIETQNQNKDTNENTVDPPGALTRIPIWGSVPAGWPAEQSISCHEEPVDYVVMKDPPEGSIGGLLVDGHSMSPEIKDGEYVLYVQTYDTRSGDIVVVNDEFGKSMVKEYYEKDGEQWLRSINPEYPRFKPNSHYRIMGRVIEVVNRRKIRRR